MQIKRNPVEFYDSFIHLESGLILHLSSFLRLLPVAVVTSLLLFYRRVSDGRATTRGSRVTYQNNGKFSTIRRAIKPAVVSRVVSSDPSVVVSLCVSWWQQASRSIKLQLSLSGNTIDRTAKNAVMLSHTEANSC